MLAMVVLVNEGSKARWKNATHPMDRMTNWCTSVC
jgi:hypothetical protein